MPQEEEPQGLMTNEELAESEAQMERLRKESSRLRLDWYSTDAILNHNDND